MNTIYTQYYRLVSYLKRKIQQNLTDLKHWYESLFIQPDESFYIIETVNNRIIVRKAK